MRIITILLCAVMLIGCSTTEQAGKIDKPAKMNPEYVNPSANAMKDAPKLEENFLNCMRDYAKGKAQISLEPFDLAEQAVEGCKFSLNLYQINLETYYGTDKKFDVQRDVYALADKGKRVVVNELIKARSR